MSKRKYNYGQPHLLRRRGKGKLWTAWINGKEVSLGTADRVEALRELETRATQRDGASSGAAPDATAMLAAVALGFAEYCKPPRHTKKTAESYSNRVASFVEWAEKNGVKRMNDVTYSVMNSYVRSRTAEGVGHATINRDTIAVRLMFAFAARSGIIPDDPFESRTFKALKLKEPRRAPNTTTLAPRDLDMFLTVAEKTVHAAYASLFRAAAGSGLRLDELRHLDADDVNAAHRTITVTPKPGWTTKGYRYRTVPVSEATITAAHAFVKARGKVRLDDKSIWEELQRVRLACDLPQFSFHELRRAWASAMHRNGASLKMVSVWLGHADVATTERYIRVYADDTTGHEFLPR